MSSYHPRTRKPSTSTSMSEQVLRQGGISRLQKYPLKLENTYQTGPKVFFPQKTVHDLTMSVLKNRLQKDFPYDADQCKMLCSSLSSDITKMVKQLGCPRYKIITTVSIGQEKQSALNCTSQALWNPEYDTYVESVHSNGEVYAVVCVYGIYQD